MNPANLTLSPVAIRFLIALIVVQAIRYVLPPGLDGALVFFLGFDLFRDGGFNPVWLYGAATSVFVHSGWLHLLSNLIWLLVLSPQITPHMTGRGFALFFIATGTAGALAHAFLNWGVSQFLVGASGAVFGLLGAGAYVLIRGADGFSKPTGKDIVKYVVMMMVVNVGYALVSGGGISWEAHAGGFFAGLALFPFLRKPPQPDPDERPPHLRVVN